MNRETLFSPCRKYRYTLWREWAHWGDDLFNPITHELKRVVQGYVQFIGLNPSTADERLDDPTIRRCIGFAKAWGFGAMCMTNIFAWRETDPKKMKRESCPIGLENNFHLLECGHGAGLVVAAWGKDGAHQNRGRDVFNMLMSSHIKVHHLGLNGDGTPKHPLYLKKTTAPVLWQ